MNKRADTKRKQLMQESMQPCVSLNSAILCLTAHCNCFSIRQIKGVEKTDHFIWSFSFSDR